MEFRCILCRVVTELRFACHCITPCMTCAVSQSMRALLRQCQSDVLADAKKGPPQQQTMMSQAQIEILGNPPWRDRTTAQRWYLPCVFSARTGRSSNGSQVSAHQFASPTVRMLCAPMAGGGVEISLSCGE